MEFLTLAAHTAAVLVVILLVGALGRLTARLLRQPEVIGEILAGLLTGPVVIAMVGTDLFGTLLPLDVRRLLKLVAQGGLMLFLVGLARELRLGKDRPGRRAVSWVTVGAFLPSLLTGVLLAAWVLLTNDAAARGPAPLPAFVFLLAVSLSITAVPVLARILVDRGITETAAGKLALAAAVVIDTAGWLLLSVAVGLGSGQLGPFFTTMAVFAGGLLLALAIKYLLRSGFAGTLCSRHPGVTAVLLGGVALAAGFAVEELGLTVIFGAVMVGLAVPGDDASGWAKPTASVTKVGSWLLPVFFVNTGITVLTAGLGPAPWALIVVTLVLGIAGKVGGGYLGARLAGWPPLDALRVGTLLNTRGLTELIVLQVGYSTGILSTPLFLALLVMALVTTALTGPLLSLIDRRELRRPVPASALAVESGAP
jgi:Kef-type K+ transport system membrane component KefB